MSSMYQGFLLLSVIILLSCHRPPLFNAEAKVAAKSTSIKKDTTQLQTGAEQTEQYLRLLKGKKVALVVNQTSVVGKQHLVDTLLTLGINITKVFAPEHGFRGLAAAGEKIANTTDQQTGLPILSLYGKTKKPTPDMLANVDVVVFDIQDVGARFYTYISTMQYVMEACAENNKAAIVLDRPNPNGHYVDGPVLEPLYKSFVGLSKIPVVHGLTVGELAQMINGEKWIGTQTCPLTVVSCKNYTHKSVYEPSIKPSPNLPNARAIYLYPSLCFFEGTVVSVGRGTDLQFQVIGAPKYPAARMPYSFAPTPHEGAPLPPYNGEICYGYDLSNLNPTEIRKHQAIDLQWLIRMYNEYPDKKGFFSNAAFFDKLAGNGKLREQIIAGQSEEDIRQSWQEDLTTFKAMRKKYLLYPDFE